MPGQNNPLYSLPVRGLIEASQNPQEAHVQEMRDIFARNANPNRRRGLFDLAGGPKETIQGKAPFFSMETDTPHVARPAMFQNDPIATDQELGAAINALYKIAPEAKGWADKFTMGPTHAAIETYTQNGIPIERFGKTNLLGIWDRGDRDISISPLTTDMEGGMPRTLVHETGHSVGIGHGRELENLEGLSLMMQDAQGLKEGMNMTRKGFWEASKSAGPTEWKKMAPGVQALEKQE